MAIITVTNLNKEFKIRKKEKGWKKLRAFFVPTYKVKHAVNNISFSIEEGESVAFIGPNGAGKSTTIKMLTGILYPTSGEVNVLGLNPNKSRRKLSHEIGSVIGQKEQLWIHLTAMENFLFFGSIYDIPKQELKARIDELVKLFEIEPFLHQSVKSLSLGQRMKCEMVASLLHKPKVLFFDEPTIGLDIIAKETLRNLIKTINKELKTTILFTSHDIGDIEEVCKRVIIINNGSIVLDDSMRNLKYRYLNKKIVEVIMRENVKVNFPDGITVMKQNDTKNSYKLEVDMEKQTIADVLGLFDSSSILDIAIETTPLEQIIKQIYKQNESL